VAATSLGERTRPVLMGVKSPSALQSEPKPHIQACDKLARTGSSLA
jgi:hypothetical protein